MSTTLKNHYFLVLTPTVFKELVYYSHNDTLQMGSRVLAPWGKRELVGLIIRRVYEYDVDSDIAKEKIKPIIEVLEAGFKTQALFQQWYAVVDWVKHYYHVHPGEVFLSAVPKKFLENKKVKVMSLKDTVTEVEQVPILLQQQQSALDSILKTKGIHLLMGATGSGKTEVYMQLAAESLFISQKVLVLVPEIGLVPQTLERFQKRFAFPVLQYHSGMTPIKRMHTWNAVMEPGGQVIIGTRSSIFLPIEQLALIIVDEEHDISLRQQDGFYYHARDIAVLRGRLQNINVVLGTATPSLESICNVKLGKYHLHQLSERAGSRLLPDWSMIDLNKQTLQAGLSQPLLNVIGDTLRRGNQVMVYINRRGYAPTMRCNDCNSIVECNFCSVKLTLHNHSKPYLQCHQCGIVTPKPKHCSECGSEQFHYLGQGTERVEAVLEDYCKGTKIFRIDSDNTRRKGALEEMLAEIRLGEPCIVLGTQMISKGHHLPHMTLVAIIDVDSMLFSNDFRAKERLAQMMMQVSGRVGRGEIRGTAILQSYYSNHPWLQTITANNYMQTLEQLLDERGQANMPPFSYMATVHSSSLNIDDPFSFLQQLRAVWQSYSKSIDITLIGPMPALIERRNRRYRFQLQVVATKRSMLHQWVREVKQWIGVQPKKNSWRCSIEIDPQTLD